MNVETNVVENSVENGSENMEGPTTPPAKKRRGRKAANKKPFRSEGAPKLTRDSESWAGYSSVNHSPLVSDDFVSMGDYCHYQYLRYAEKTEEYRLQTIEADKLAALGSDNAAAKVLQLQRKLEKLKAELGSDAQALIAELLK